MDYLYPEDLEAQQKVQVEKRELLSGEVNTVDGSTPENWGSNMKELSKGDEEILGGNYIL